ncbi:MAG: hypothetical protein JNJ97_03540 [Alphaproteobacteria bacterium]|nr:hypothetical protein [Alphaproteobacteria bacterium]
MSAYLPALRQAAEAASKAEDAYRREAAAKIAALETARSHTFRRLNLMTRIADVVREVERDDQAGESARLSLADRLDWAPNATGGRKEALDAFVPVAQALRAGDDAATEAELAKFEAWYETRFGSSFWELFANNMPETPRVDY